MKANSWTLMITLFHNCLPFAVAWAVPQIVIFSSKRGGVRANTHIGQKVNKLVPCCMNLNTTTTVIGIFPILFMVTSGNHCVPRSECRCGSRSAIALFSCVAMSCKSLCGLFSQALSTLKTSSRNESSGINYGSIPTFTFNKTSPFFGFQEFCDYFSLSKYSPSKRLSSRHGIGCFNVLFSGGRSAVTGAHCDYV